MSAACARHGLLLRVSRSLGASRLADAHRRAGLRKIGAATRFSRPFFSLSGEPAAERKRAWDSRAHGVYERQHLERRVVPFTPREVYDVVADVDEYHDFVPWCTDSAVIKRIDDRHVVADLAVGFRLLSERYTSVITLNPTVSVNVDVPNSTLFEYLINDWTFEEGPRAGSTELTFFVEFAFRNPLYQRATDLFFEDVVKQMVSAFERRCHIMYRPTARRRGVLSKWSI